MRLQGDLMRATIPPPRCRGGRPTPGCRHGFSLVEVVLSTLILVGGVAAATHLIYLGLWGADMSRARAIGALLAETKLAELEAGLPDASTDGSGEFEDHPGFRWEVSRQSGTVPGIETVTVKITYEAHDDSFDFSVTRWLARDTQSF